MIRRQVSPVQHPADPRFTHLRDITSGVIIVCGQCPLGRLDRGHWTATGCLCPKGEAS